jgi:S-adenosyl-L-methionine hydrolase (adenosine-forming)
MTTGTHPRPVITLTTDFGTRDHYVGTMKGVLASTCPEALIIDITHDIQHFDIWSGAYAISQAAPFFPAGSIHVVVVDPGVGTARRGISCVSGEQVFIAPDNGVLSLAIEETTRYRTRELQNPELWRKPASNTFHGRDLFAPSAAKLAAGVLRWDDLGPELDAIVRLPHSKVVEERQGFWRACVQSVDHFGNVITNLQVERVPLQKSRFRLSSGGHTIDCFRQTFGEARRDELFVYAGSSGFYEIGINQESAAKILGASPGDPIILEVKP